MAYRADREAALARVAVLEAELARVRQQVRVSEERKHAARTRVAELAYELATLRRTRVIDRYL